MKYKIVIDGETKTKEAIDVTNRVNKHSDTITFTKGEIFLISEDSPLFEIDEIFKNLYGDYKITVLLKELS
jgi:hypothetical protein